MGISPEIRFTCFKSLTIRRMLVDLDDKLFEMEQAEAKLKVLQAAINTASVQIQPSQPSQPSQPYSATKGDY